MIFVNAFLLLLWLRILPQKQESFFNPYVAGGMSLLGRLYSFFNAAAWKVPEIFVAAIILVFSIFFRGVVMSFNGHPWGEIVGFWNFSTDNLGPGRCVLFSFVSFAWLLHRLWSLELLLSFLNRHGRQTRISGALSALAMPVSNIPRWQRAVFIFAYGMLLGIMFYHTSLPIPAKLEGWTTLELTPAPLPLALFSIVAFANVILTAADLVMYLIIISFAGLLMRSATITTMSREALDYIIGTIMKRKILIASMDFTPVVFYAAASFIYPILMGVLRYASTWAYSL